MSGRFDLACARKKLLKVPGLRSNAGLGEHGAGMCEQIRRNTQRYRMKTFALAANVDTNNDLGTLRHAPPALFAQT